MASILSGQDATFCKAYTAIYSIWYCLGLEIVCKTNAIIKWQFDLHAREIISNTSVCVSENIREDWWMLVNFSECSQTIRKFTWRADKYPSNIHWILFSPKFFSQCLNANINNTNETSQPHGTGHSTAFNKQVCNTESTDTQYVLQWLYNVYIVLQRVCTQECEIHFAAGHYAQREPPRVCRSLRVTSSLTTQLIAI